MEIIKQIGISLLLTVQATFWFVKLLIAKLFWFVQKNILVLVLIFLAGCEKSVGPVDGTTQTTLGVFAEQINNVVNIYGGYTDNCGVRHQSQLSVKVVNNF